MFKRFKNISSFNKSAFGIFMLMLLLSVGILQTFVAQQQNATYSVAVKKQSTKAVIKSSHASDDSCVFQDEKEIEEDETDGDFLRIGSFSFTHFLFSFKRSKTYTLVVTKKTVTAPLYALYCNWKLHLL